MGGKNLRGATFEEPQHARLKTPLGPTTSPGNVRIGAVHVTKGSLPILEWGDMMRFGVTSAMPDEQNLRTTQQCSVLVWTTILRLTHKRQLGQRTKRKYQPSDCLVEPRRQPPFSYHLLGYKGATSEGAKLNQTFKRIEAYLLNPTGPRKFASTSTLKFHTDKGLDVCVDLAGSSSLTQTMMVDFVPSRAMIDAAHHKRVKYEAKSADIGYGFLPFSFSSLGELDKDAVTLLKRIRKFSVTQDIGVCAAIHILLEIKKSLGHS
ncbi:hypothetical protein Tco_0491911 [Tanacetum coccineum]